MRIEDYALISDCQSAALVGRDSSIDWLCFPRFDSPACFAALLGKPEHGRWLLAPVEKVEQTSRRYREGTLILETNFETDTGAVTVVDCMPPHGTDRDVIRIVVGKRGEVPMRMELVIRFDHGSIIPWVRRIHHGIHAIAGPDALLLQGDVPVRGEQLTTVAEFTVAEGQQVSFVLRWHRCHEALPPTVDAGHRLAATARWWRKWSSQCTYEGPWKEAVLRSLVTLKGLTYHPTGGIVAAATTSLPEQLGSVRNWDYRYCWVRDATFTLDALLRNGYPDEAQAWRGWLVRAVAGTPSQMNIMYGVAGERRLSEMELEWLPGYENSAPVRIGNAAWKQFQLDVFGEVNDALYLAQKAGLAADENSWRVQRGLLKFLESAWNRPDDGIWEVRGPQRHFTHSKVMAWVAVDRMIKMAEQFGGDATIERWRALRSEIHDEVCQKGFDSKKNSFVQYYGSSALDASLLMIPLVGFLPPKDPRVKGTVAAIERELLDDGFVSRYATSKAVDGLPPGEGAFLPCTFWLADNYALQGRLDDARRIFEQLLTIRNDVGLLAEEYDPHARRQLGNFPQAFSHVGLINTAWNIAGPGQGPAHERKNR
jgi:GH15 family glucan-1,4-alpha-glucosidase